MEGGSLGTGRTARYLSHCGGCRLITFVVVAAFVVSLIAASLYPTSVFSHASVILNGQTLKRNLSAFPKPGALLDVEEIPGSMDTGGDSQEDDYGTPLPSGDSSDDDYALEKVKSVPKKESEATTAPAVTPDILPAPQGQSVPGNPGTAPNPGVDCDDGPKGPYDLPSLSLTEPEAVPATQVTSFATNFGTISGVGSYTKRYWLLQNVQLSNESTITFFHSPKTKAPVSNVVDLITGNASAAATAPALPTAAIMRAGQTKDYSTLNLRFVSAAEKQPACARWEHRPVYLLTMQHNENVFHAWADGLLSAFQTLREQGHLPLADVDADGAMTEHVADLPEECPRVFDPPAHLIKNAAASVNATAEAAVEVTRCRPRRSVIPPGTRCDPKRDAWCRPGLVAPYAAKKDSGPVLLPFPGVEVAPQWAHMFSALSADVLSWNRSEGTCFRELYMGRSNVLNFYLPLEPSEGATQRTVANAAAAATHRAEAMEAVKELMMTAERAHVEEEKRLAADSGEKSTEWKGYEDSGLERLRRGVGRGDFDALAALRPTKQRAMELAQMTEAEWDELDALLDASEKEVGKAVREAERQRRRQQRHRRALAESPSDAKSSADKKKSGKERPVVTYMWRNNFKRSVLNAGDILSYILARYDVTVRVTTFEEPLLKSMELIASTDVLIGMHGAGWANAMFVPRGTAVLQLLPYGWLLEDGTAIRGQAFQAMARANECVYSEWVNKDPERAFMRRWDFEGKKAEVAYALHPTPEWGLPIDQRPGNHWVYQNTVVDIRDLAPAIDAAMAAAGIEPVDA